MVHVYNCHPYASQQIVQQEPGLVCCGGGSLFVVEAYNLEQEGCPLLCRFATMGTVRSILHSNIGDYLVTIEEKNSSTYLRAYTNWRYQKARVGVRLLGHLLRGASQRGGVQMEIIEIPLSERPVAVACCPLTGDLLVGCDKTLVLFTLRRQNQQNMVINFCSPVALCAGYVAVQAELEVLVLKLHANYEPKDLAPEETSAAPKDGDQIQRHQAEDQIDFLLLPRHQELLGERAANCDIPVSIEKTALEDSGQNTFSYVLFRCVAIVHQNDLSRILLFFCRQSGAEEPACVFCFFSLPTAGYLYSLKGGVELLSTYQYPEKVLEAVLTDHLLHVITKSALQCFTVRCAAVAARLEDPYIDTTMRACPPCNLEVCALRMQLFIGLRSVRACGRHVILFSTRCRTWMEPLRGRNGPSTHSLPRDGKVDLLTPFPPRAASTKCVNVTNLSPRGQVEYSQHYAQNKQHAQSLWHLLSEAHLLLRAALLQSSQPTATEQAFQENCAQLGDCFSRGSQRHCHQALPYYRMSGLSVTDVMARNRPLPSSPHAYGPGFLFYLKHYLLEETDQHLAQEAADEVIDIFSQSEPSQLIAACASPTMTNVSPDRTLRILQHLEASAGVSVALTITMATMALRLDDLAQYAQLMERHAEMVLVYGFIEEPRLLLHGGGAGQRAAIAPTALSHQMAKSQPGLLVASMVALHENNKVQLEQVDQMFQVLGCENSLQVDFWEATLMASSQEAVIQELLFRLSSVYIDRLTHTSTDKRLVQPLARVAQNAGKSSAHELQLQSRILCIHPVLCFLQSLLCGPSLPVASVAPLLESLPDQALWGFSLHLLCATRRGQYDRSIEDLLDRCPQAIIAYANHHLQDQYMDLWWKKLLPELCHRTRVAPDNCILLAALKETLVVVATETSPAQFLELLPEDGTASYFLPHLLTCSQRHLLA
uniref:HPS3 biogenesis of lysosomal organelles complex 2 subunit 1 n=1 Tax=Hippocampus comes TaxID=109280 RepID=A0A3Q2YTZ5_HIPCM